jgi:hypothetical protein
LISNLFIIKDCGDQQPLKRGDTEKPYEWGDLKEATLIPVAFFHTI